MNKCVICGKEYEAKRVMSKYCGSGCRKLAFRNKNGKHSVPVSVPPVTVTESTPERTADVPELISSELLRPARRVAGALSKERQLSKHGFNG